MRIKRESMMQKRWKETNGRNKKRRQKKKLWGGGKVCDT